MRKQLAGRDGGHRAVAFWPGMALLGSERADSSFASLPEDEPVLCGHPAHVPGFVMCFNSHVPSHTALFCYSILELKTLVRRDFQSENGKPEKAKELKQLVIEYDGFLISCPE